MNFESNRRRKRWTPIDDNSYRTIYYFLTDKTRDTLTEKESGLVTLLTFCHCVGQESDWIKNTIGLGPLFLTYIL